MSEKIVLQKSCYLHKDANKILVSHLLNSLKIDQLTKYCNCLTAKDSIGSTDCKRMT